MYQGHAQVQHARPRPDAVEYSRCQFLGNGAWHVEAASLCLCKNRAHQQGAVGTDGRSIRTPLRTQDTCHKGSMQAGNALGLGTCPAYTPRNLMDMLTLKIGMGGCDRSIKQPDHNFG